MTAAKLCAWRMPFLEEGADERGFTCWLEGFPWPVIHAVQQGLVLVLAVNVFWTCALAIGARAASSCFPRLHKFAYRKLTTG